MGEFVIKLAISAGLAAAIKVAVLAFGDDITWWLAALIALVLVFGGWLIIVELDGDS